MSNIIQSLWIGEPLSKMEQLSIKSFRDFGHEYHLYTYGTVKNIPEGTVVKDGNEIVPASEIFRYKNGSVSAFSNLFRFELLHQKGGYWADTDLICVKPPPLTLRPNDEYLFSSEPDRSYSPKRIVNAGLIKMPKNSIVALEGVELQKKQKKLILAGNVAWSSGPKTVQHLVRKYNLTEYVLPWQGICSCHWSDFRSLFDPTLKFNSKVIQQYNKIPPEMVGIHLWNEIWRRNKIDKNDIFHSDSLYEVLKKNHGLRQPHAVAR